MRAKARHQNVPGSVLFLLLIAVIAASTLVAPARAASASLYLRMVGEAPLADGTTPVVVAGIWHEIDVNLTATPSQDVTLSAVLPGASPASIANTYRWTYSASNGSFSDILYGIFLNEALSTASSAQVVFVVGLDASATPGIWSLTAMVGNATVVSESVEVQAPLVSYGVSTPDFTLRVDPFTPSQNSTRSTGQALLIRNQGNVPLTMRVQFASLQSALSVDNPSTTAHVGSSAQYFLDLSVGSLPPQIITVDGETNVTPTQVVPSTGAAQITAAFQQPFTVTIDVGHSGYAIHTVGNVVFQTPPQVAAAYGSITTWLVYLSGAQNVTFDLALSGLQLRGILSGSNALSLPASLTLSPTSEVALTIEVEPVAGGVGLATFTVHLLGTGDTQSFTTQVVVTGGSSPHQAGTVLALWIGGAALAAGVFGFVAFDTVRRRKQGRAAAAQTPKKKGYHARQRERAQNRARKHGKGTNGKARPKGVGQDHSRSAPARERRP